METTKVNQTKIKLIGEGQYVCIDFKFKDGRDACAEYGLIYEGVELYQYIGECELEDITSNDEDWIDITKKKGKYLKGKFISQEIGCPEEIEFGTSKWIEFESEFIINHEGEFNPKLLQLRKSDYEFINIPYGIFTHVVYYDGQPVLCIDDDEWVGGWTGGLNYETYHWDGFYYTNK